MAEERCDAETVNHRDGSGERLRCEDMLGHTEPRHPYLRDMVGHHAHDRYGDEQVWADLDAPRLARLAK